MRRTFAFGSHSCTVSVVPHRELHDGLDERTFCVADRSTARYLPERGIHLVLPAGEASKSWPELERILATMLESDLTRTSAVVGVGGGVVTDISAFAASVYMRGCRLILVPTTLLAMVDAAVGGKTGINFGGYKNMIGSFYPADEVRISTETLATLSEREYRSGLAEVIKTALLGDERLLALLEDEQPRVLGRESDLLAEIVWACASVKGEIVESDLTESGIRAYLNLGHTFGHALETVQGLGSWSHGEAVAWGIARAMELGVLAGITDRGYASRVRALLERYGYRINPLPEAAEAIRTAMQKDKKR
ncbi:MAG: 3-dehydroquinate synthase, partial [Spirochaetota bacterium]